MEKNSNINILVEISYFGNFTQVLNHVNTSSALEKAGPSKRPDVYASLASSSLPFHPHFPYSAFPGSKCPYLLLCPLTPFIFTAASQWLMSSIVLATSLGLLFFSIDFFEGSMFWCLRALALKKVTTVGIKVLPFTSCWGLGNIT